MYTWFTNALKTYLKFSLMANLYPDICRPETCADLVKNEPLKVQPKTNFTHFVPLSIHRISDELYVYLKFLV
jgi:hypothetical protein